jgi:hypothetical protein
MSYGPSQAQRQVIQSRFTGVSISSRGNILTKLNIIHLGLIAILFAGLAVHTAGADTDTGPIALTLPIPDL